MAEYWYIKPGYEDLVRNFLDNPLPPEIRQEYEIRERDFFHAGNAAATVKLTLKRLGVDPVILRRTAIVGYEAEINVTAHSRGGRMVCDIHQDLVHLKFQDVGPGMPDIEKSMEPGFSTADEQVREMGFGAGLGLPNIEKNTDMLHIISGSDQQTFLEAIIYFKSNE